MSNTNQSTIAALFYAHPPILNFAALVADLDGALRECPHERSRLEWDCDDVAVFDLDGTRMILGWADRALGDEMSCLSIGIGTGPVQNGPDRLLAQRDGICTLIVERVNARHPADVLIWHKTEGLLTGELLDDVVETLVSTGLKEGWFKGMRTTAIEHVEETPPGTGQANDHGSLAQHEGTETRTRVVDARLAKAGEMAPQETAATSHPSPAAPSPAAPSPADPSPSDPSHADPSHADAESGKAGSGDAPKAAEPKELNDGRVGMARVDLPEDAAPFTTENAIAVSGENAAGDGKGTPQSLANDKVARRAATRERLQKDLRHADSVAASNRGRSDRRHAANVEGGDAVERLINRMEAELAAAAPQSPVGDGTDPTGPVPSEGSVLARLGNFISSAENRVRGIGSATGPAAADITALRAANGSEVIEDLPPPLVPRAVRPRARGQTTGGRAREKTRIATEAAIMVANDMPDLPKTETIEVKRIRAALYPEVGPTPADQGDKTVAMRLAVGTLSCTLVVVATPIGAALLTYNALGGANFKVTARVMALTGAVMAFGQTQLGSAVMLFI